MDQAEKLRNVIKLQNQAHQPSARVITVTSGKGGVGKSNLAVNLAVWMSRMGKRVAIFDADFGLANVEVMFGAVPKYNLSDVICRGMSVREIITEGPEGICFLSGGTGVLELNDLTREQVRQLVQSLQELDQLVDVILVDTGAGISPSVLEFVVASPEVLLLATPDPSSLTDAYSLLKAMYHHPAFDRAKTSVAMVANRVASETEARAVYAKLSSVVGQFLQGEIRYLGMIPQDASVEKAIRQQKPVTLQSPQSPAAQAFETLAKELLGGTPADQTGKSFSQLFTDLMKK